MRNYKQEGNIIHVLAPYDLLQGAGVLVGSLFGLATADCKAGAQTDIITQGEFYVAKTSAEAWAVGDKVYWNNTTKKFTTVFGIGRLAGLASEVAANPSSTGSLLLSPQPGMVDAGTNLVTGRIATQVAGRNVDAVALTWRGINQGMSVDVQGFGGGSAYSMLHRTRHYSNTRFRRVRAVLQCFQPLAGTPIVDTNFTNDYNFQVGFEQVYQNATTGLSPRKMFKFGSSEVAQYRQASPPANGYLISDVLDLGSYVEAEQFFGLWTTVEEATAGTPITGRIPYTRSSSNFLQRYVGYASLNGTTVAQSQIALDTAKSATSITAAPATQGGNSNYFTPIMLLIETDSGDPFIWFVGDSLSYGVGEGGSGSGSEGDGVGSALGNRGFIERGIWENLGYSGGGLGRGSDGNKYLITPSNWAYRRALLQLANPTHVINANVHNDMQAGISYGSWAISTAYAKWDTKQANSNIYVCVVAGTSAASGTGPASTSGGIVDGTCVWAYLQPIVDSTVRGAAQVLVQMANVNQQIRAILPNVNMIAMTATPDAASTDNWATAVNQTPSSGGGYGGPTSRRHYVNDAIRSLHPLLDITGYFDPSAAVEDSYPTETSKWAVNGSAYYATIDGTHGNSVGYRLGAATLTADKFV